MINTIDDMVGRKEISVNKAVKLLEQECDRKFGENHQPTSPETPQKQASPNVVGTTTADDTKDCGLSGKSYDATDSKPKTEQPAQEEQGPDNVRPDLGDLSAKFLGETAKASARAKRPEPSKLESAAKVIARAADLLDDIVEGRLNDNGTEGDMFAAATIKNHGPRVIINYYRLGIDPSKAVKFYEGENQNDTELMDKGDT